MIVQDELKAGDKISEYILIEKIGEGRFAGVWKAKHTQIPNKIVAIKIPRNKEYLENIKKEAILQHNFEHPNIVKTLGLDLDHTPPYFVMEYVPGVNLKKLICEDGILPANAAINIALQILSALHLVHSKGIIHRDIKPENIIVVKLTGKTPTGKRKSKYIAKLSDLGLGHPSKEIGEEIALSTTSDKTNLKLSGSLFYASPEVLTGQKPDERADLYSVGVVLFEMLTGVLPFGIDLPSELNPFVHPVLDNIVKKALCYDRDKRYQSAKQMAEDLLKAKRIVKQEIYQLREQSRTTQKQEKQKPKQTQKKHFPIIEICAIILAIAALIMLAIALYLVFQQKKDTQATLCPIVITTEPEGAQVFINGKNFGTTPLTIYNLPFTQHKIVLEKRFYECKTLVLNPSPKIIDVIDADSNHRLFESKAKDKIVLNLKLSPLPGELVIIGQGPAKVFIDNKPAGELPLKLKINQGIYSVSIRKEGHKPKNFLAVVSGKTEINDIALEPEQSLATVVINSDPQGATVFIDDKPLGTTPCEILVNPGKIKVKIVKKYFHPQEMEIDTASGIRQQISVSLKKLKCLLQVNSIPQGADIFLSSTRIGRTPFSSEVPAGKYQIEIALEGYNTYSQEIDLFENKPYQIEAKLVPLRMSSILTIDCEIKGLPVWINDKIVGQTPLSIEHTPGEISIRVLDCIKKLDLQSSKDYEVKITLSDLGLALVPEGNYQNLKGNITKVKGFYIDKFEVTNKKYRDFLSYIQRTGDHSRCHPEEPKNKDHTPRFWHDPKLNGDEHPVVGVDFYDAYAYAAWAGKSLPTELEWERAAAGDKFVFYPWGNKWQPDLLNWGDAGRVDGFVYTSPVGSFPEGKSIYSCYDMVGNVWEMCMDDYDTIHKVIRGGSYIDEKSVTIDSRHFINKHSRHNDVGFRCVLRIQK